MTPLRHLIAKDNPISVTYAARTVVAAVASLLVARLTGLPEPYWAGITTLAVVQSTSSAALPVAVQYFAGTAVGAALGGWASDHLPVSPFVFGACVLAIGILFTPFKIERAAYRFASITLAIVMLVRPNSGWTLPVHRFVLVCVGIAVGLVVSALWPERDESR
jgi:uncharacterized membrane protein YccC